MSDETSISSLHGAKKKEVVRITAKSFFDEMVDYGFNDGDIINFTTAILELLMAPSTGRQSRSTQPRYEPSFEYRPDGTVLRIHGPQLTLSRLGSGHLQHLVAWRQSASYRGTLIERVLDADPAEVLRRFDSDLRELFLVLLAEDPTPLGFVTYERDWGDPTRAEMQKFLADKRQRGRGYGTQMTYLWLHYGFHHLGLRKVSARTVDSNLANINLNRKLGFHFEGHLRKEVKLGESFVDVTIMSVLREGFLELFEPPHSTSAT